MTQVYPLGYAKEERRWSRLKLAVSCWVADIFRFRFVAPRQGITADTPSSLRLAESGKSPATRLGDIFKMGSSHLMEAEYQLLLHGIRNAVRRLPESAAHLYARGGVPDFIFNERMENGHSEEVEVNPVSISNWSDECGYALRVEDPEARSYAPEVAAELIYRWRRPSDDLANTIAERQRRWLVGNRP